MDKNTILEVRNLSLVIGESKILSSVSFDIIEGKRIGIAGPSGSGKTMLAWTIVGGQPSGAKVDGNVKYCSDGTPVDLLNGSLKGFSSLLGKEIAIIPQNPFSSLNPARTCGDQIREAVRARKLSRPEMKTLGIETLQKMGFGDPERIHNAYPHQLSGGQLQRVVIAMAIINMPRLLIADEPTTALDTMTTDHILNLLDAWVTENAASLLLVSHDWAVLSKMCNVILSLERGEVVSTDDVEGLNISTRMLGGAVRRSVESTQESRSSVPILEVEHLTKSFARRRKDQKRIVAVNDLSFLVAQGESLGIVGESGSGKSTLAKLLTGLEVPDSGTMKYDTQKVNYRENPHLRKEIQMIFQDPYSALYPHRTVGYSIEEPLKLFHKMNAGQRRSKALELMKIVDLDEAYYDRLPGKLSGGERQRVQIARALSVNPSLLICDECISGLDIPVQARILNLLQSLKEDRNISIIFISHDLNAVRFICDNVAVISNGEIIETGATLDILGNPQHEITQNLVSAMLLFDE
jgi:ABC-type glutathione transport system ATPase component